MSRILSAAGALVDTIKINILVREERAGRMFWIKRRTRAARPIMACANCFFRLAGNPVVTLSDLATWREWEVENFLRLHGERFRAFPDGATAVAAEEVPGRSLSQHLNAGTLNARILTAAGKELRRAHGYACAAFGGEPWSHGDPHAGNFVYEQAGDRARLIDFEVMHRPELDARERQADDLLVFLQDIVGRIAAEQWLPGALAFLGAYGRPEIVARLRERLVVPGGIARIWWAVRTTYLDLGELRRRLAELRASL